MNELYKIKNFYVSKQTPQRFTFVQKANGDQQEIRIIEGQIFVCKGLKCGNEEKGYPPVPLSEYKQQWNHRGFRLRVHLTIIEGCLGPCTLANVVMLTLYGKTLWLHSINEKERVTEIYSYIQSMLDNGGYLSPPSSLKPYIFTRYGTDEESHPDQWHLKKVGSSIKTHSNLVA